MKKLIAISVMLVLIAGAVFAETSVGGGVDTRMKLLIVDSDGNLTTEAVGLGDHFIQLSGQNEEGTLGALLRPARDANNYAYVWWQPIPQLKIFLGQNGDGMFGSDGLVSWSYYKQGTDYLSNHDWGLWRDYFPGNWDAFGLALSLYPVEGLSINFAFPMGSLGTNSWDEPLQTLDTVDWFRRLEISVDYGIADIGTLFVRYKLPRTGDNGGGQAHLSFNITAIESLQIQPGVTLRLNEGTPDILIGLGFWFTGDGFGINLRAGAQLLADNTVKINAGLLPYFALGENATAYVQLETVATDSGDLNMTIYPSLKAFFGPGWIGFGVRIDFDNASAFGVSVPVIFSFGF